MVGLLKGAGRGNSLRMGSSFLWPIWEARLRPNGVPFSGLRDMKRYLAVIFSVVNGIYTRGKGLDLGA